MDKDTQKIQLKGEQLRELVKHEGWKHAEDMLMESIRSLGNILELDNPDPQKLMAELAGRQMAVQAMTEWLSQVYGEVKSYEDMLVHDDEKDPDYIERI